MSVISLVGSGRRARPGARSSSSARLTILALVLLHAAPAARAGGLALDATTPAGASMAGAVTALPGDASAIATNPAGLALQAGSGVLVGGGVSGGTTRVTTAGGAVDEAGSTWSGVPSLFVAARAGDRLVAGIGVYQAFGAGAGFGGGSSDGNARPFAGRFVATSSRLRSLTINPTLALRLTDRVALGFGFDVTLASLELRRSALLGGGEYQAHLGGTADASSWNFGVQAQIVPGRLAVGLAFRSGFDLAVDGRVHFTAPVELAPLLADQAATATVTLPHTLAAGLAVQPGGGVTLTLDVQLALWSDARRFAIRFPTGSVPDLQTALGWRDAASLRLGLEWRAAPGLALRLGLGYDQTPAPAATLGPLWPGNDRFLVGAGLAWTLTRTAARGLGLCAGYLAGLGLDRTSSSPDLPGAAWHQATHLLLAAVTFRWGADGVEERLSDEKLRGTSPPNSLILP